MSSPFEHCARTMSDEEYNSHVNGKIEDYSTTMEGYQPTEESFGWCRNFRGFIQYRHLTERR